MALSPGDELDFQLRLSCLTGELVQDIHKLQTQEPGLFPWNEGWVVFGWSRYIGIQVVVTFCHIESKTGNSLRHPGGYRNLRDAVVAANAQWIEDLADKLEVKMAGGELEKVNDLGALRHYQLKYLAC